MWKRLCLESQYTYLWKWKILSKYYGCSTIICHQVIDRYNKEVKTIPTNFHEKKVTCKTQNFYSLLAFLLVTMALTIVFTVSIYCYFKLNLKSIVLIV